MGLEPRREKRESCITCRRMLRMTPFFPPKLGEKPYLEKDSLFGHSLFRVLLHWIHGHNVKRNYNAKFLEAIDFAFKKCHLVIPLCLRRKNCKLFMQSLPVMMVLLNLQQDLASLFATWLFLSNVCDFLRSESDVNCKSVLLIVSPNQMDDI